MASQNAKHVLLRRVLDELFGQCARFCRRAGAVRHDGLPEIGFPVGYQPHAASGREVPIGAIVGGQP